MMHDWKVSALPVLKGEGRVVGVVSEADLLPKEEFRDSDPDPPGAPITQLRRLSDLAKAGAVTMAHAKSVARWCRTSSPPRRHPHASRSGTVS
ncbi:CBS-domain-containing membrane protein [Streptomyces sp. SAI-127]|nr:CBS-domain-containing membrane protein [Streptomyces sp. SAI-127]